VAIPPKAEQLPQSWGNLKAPVGRISSRKKGRHDESLPEKDEGSKVLVVMTSQRDAEREEEPKRASRELY